MADNEFDNEFDPTGGPRKPEEILTPEKAPEKIIEPEMVPDPKPVVLAPRSRAPVVLSAEKRKELQDLVIPGITDRPVNNLSYSDEALLTKEKLAEEEKVAIFVQFDPGEKRGAYRSVTINGYRIEVAKGKQQKLPKSVAALIMDAYDIENDTLNNNEYNLANADELKREKLNA